MFRKKEFEVVRNLNFHCSAEHKKLHITSGPHLNRMSKCAGWSESSLGMSQGILSHVAGHTLSSSIINDQTHIPKGCRLLGLNLEKLYIVYVNFFKSINQINQLNSNCSCEIRDCLSSYDELSNNMRKHTSDM